MKQCLPPPRDWTEREERRRTFWMAFCQDRYASIGTGWPMAVDENDIMSNLPCSEEAFEMSRPETTLTLPESMTPAGAGKLSSFGSIVLMACLFGRNLKHLHGPDADDSDDQSMNGEFWRRHRTLDNILLNTSLCLPPQLRLPAGMQNANAIFTNMCIHTSTICLHQAAIFKADTIHMPPTVSGESKIRCITAASEIASIMRMVSHLDLAAVRTRFPNNAWLVKTRTYFVCSSTPSFPSVSTSQPASSCSTSRAKQTTAPYRTHCASSYPP